MNRYITLYISKWRNKIHITCNCFLFASYWSYALLELYFFFSLLQGWYSFTRMEDLPIFFTWYADPAEAHIPWFWPHIPWFWPCQTSKTTIAETVGGQTVARSSCPINQLPKTRGKLAEHASSYHCSTISTPIIHDSSSSIATTICQPYHHPP